jgi:hypothetical protein
LIIFLTLILNPAWRHPPLPSLPLIKVHHSWAIRGRIGPSGPQRLMAQMFPLVCCVFWHTCSLVALISWSTPLSRNLWVSNETQRSNQSLFQHVNIIWSVRPLQRRKWAKE